MKKLVLCGTMCVALAGMVAAAELTDADVRTLIVAESIAAYSGQCPCPCSFDKDNELCGKRSAWSRKDGERPICFSQDVTDEQVHAYRERKVNSEG